MFFLPEYYNCTRSIWTGDVLPIRFIHGDFKWYCRKTVIS